MSIYKPMYRDKNGKKKKISKWWVEVTDDRKDAKQRKVRLAAYPDKEASRQFEQNIQTLISRKATGGELDVKLANWLDSLSQKLLEKFANLGWLDNARVTAGKPLSEHVDDFEYWLSTTKAPRTGYHRSDTHVKTTCRRVRQVFEKCGFTYWSDIVVGKVEECLGGLDVRANTFNYYLTALKHFCQWMVDNDRANTMPLRKLRRLRVEKSDHRRALSFDEVCRLLTVAEKAPTRFGMTGHERAVLYLLAMETGLRVGELQSLTLASFDFQSCSVTAKAESCKNRQEAEQLLKHKRAAQLQDFFNGTMLDVRAFNMPSNFRTGKMIEADLTEAGIAYVDEAGRKADFHALRHTLATNLDQTGASVKERMTIMRHSDKSNLTLGVYTKVTTFDIRKRIERLPDYPWPGSEQSERVKVSA